MARSGGFGFEYEKENTFFDHFADDFDFNSALVHRDRRYRR